MAVVLVLAVGRSMCFTKKAGACACSKNGLTSPQVQATSGRDEQAPDSSAMSFHLRPCGYFGA